MKKELDEQLCAKYPKIFADRHGDMKSTAMCWGIECGDGWYWLIDKLCASIQGYLDNNPHLQILDVVATQVKEKYGGLRFYFYGGDALIEGMVWLAEHMSYAICETCGSTQNVSQSDGWIVTLCDKCQNKDNNG